MRCEAAHRRVVATIVCVEPCVFCLKQVGAGELRTWRICYGCLAPPRRRDGCSASRVTRCRGRPHYLRWIGSAGRIGQARRRCRCRGSRRGRDGGRSGRGLRGRWWWGRRRERTARAVQPSADYDLRRFRRPELEPPLPVSLRLAVGADGAASLAAVSRRVTTEPSLPNGAAGAPLTDTSSAPASPEWMLTSRVAVSTRLSPGCRKPDVPALPSVPRRTHARRRAETVTDNGAGVVAPDDGEAAAGADVTDGAGVVVPSGAAEDDAQGGTIDRRRCDLVARMAHIRHGATPRGPADVKGGGSAYEHDCRANCHQKAALTTTLPADRRRRRRGVRGHFDPARGATWARMVRAPRRLRFLRRSARNPCPAGT